MSGRTLQFAIRPQLYQFALSRRMLVCLVVKNFMNSQDADLIKARVRQWNAAMPVLQDVRDKDIQLADTARAMKCFSGAVLAALPKHPPQPWSGLVEQQRFFCKLRTL